MLDPTGVTFMAFLSSYLSYLVGSRLVSRGREEKKDGEERERRVSEADKEAIQTEIKRRGRLIE